jgi:uncharacterized protein (DUF2236 family)
MNLTMERPETTLASAPVVVQPMRLGKDSVVYNVLNHQPVAGLLAGVPALSLQVLHPSIGGGVYAHSTLKQRPINRLARTAQYVAGTAAGSDEDAVALIERTNRRHKPVKGNDPKTGSPFSADDPDLQVYVHTTEFWAILEAAKFVGLKVTREEEDRYWTELQPIGAYLGARVELVPATKAQALAVIEGMGPKLAQTDEGKDVIAFLLRPTGSLLFTVTKPLLFLNRWATAAMLPPDITEMIGLTVRPRRDHFTRGLLRAIMAVGGPFFTWLTFKLTGPEVKRYYREFPEHTTTRSFTLPLPKAS